MVMISDAIKEKLNLFRLYLGLILASIGMITMWVVQNFDDTHFIVISALVVIFLIKFIFFILFDRKITKRNQFIGKVMSNDMFISLAFTIWSAVVGVGFYDYTRCRF